MYVYLYSYRNLLKVSHIKKKSEFENWTFKNYFYISRGELSHMALENLVNTGSGNGLLPDGTKPLTEPMLTYHQ